MRVMIVLAASLSGLVLAATSTSTPSPAPLPDASRTQRGAVNTQLQVFEGMKVFDGGIATRFIDAGVVRATTAVFDQEWASFIDAGIVATTLLRTPVQNSTVTVQGDCNPATTTCSALIVNNTAPSTSNKIAQFQSNGSNKFTIYSTGTTDNYPANTSTNVCFVNVVQDVSGASGVTFVSDRPQGSGSPDFEFDTAANPTSHANLKISQNGTSTWQVQNGSTYGGVQFGPPSFVDNSGASGHVALSCADSVNGCYTAISGFLHPSPSCGVGAYAGNHGAVTVQADCAMDAGYVFQALNSDYGTERDFFITYKGGLVWKNAPSLASFPPCPPDGGPGPADESTIQYDSAGGDFYMCRATAWDQFVTSRRLFPDDFQQMAQRHGTSACSGGTKALTFTTAFGATPDCTASSKTANPVWFSTGPSSSGFTVTCTGTDAFMWSCTGQR